MAITRYAGDRFTIGAGETKPTGVLDGAVLIDTGNLELYVKRDGVWVEITGAGTDALPGAPLNSVQFNNAGSFGGDADLTFTDGNRLNVNKLGISGNIYDSNNSIGNDGMVLTNEGTTGVNWKAIEDVLSGVGGSGVANYVARWADEDTLTSGVLYDNGTNAGVGTASPLGKFDVLRSSSATPGLIARSNKDGAKMNFAYTNTNSMGEIGTTYYNSTGAMRLWIGGNLNSNSTGHVGPTQQGASSSSWFSEYNTNNDYYQINRIAAGGGTSSSTLFYITSVGNVGIGGVTPTLGKLQVAGRGYFGPVGTGDATTKALMDTYSVLKLKPHDSNSTNMTFAQVNNGAGIGIQVTNGTQTADWDIALNPYGGNVGIGTPSPSTPLHIRKIDLVDNSRNALLLLDGKFADATIESADEVGIAFRVENSGGGAQQTTSITSSYQASYNSLNLQPAGGNVGIGTPSPDAKLEIKSDGSAAGGAEIRLTHANNNSTDVVSTVNFANNVGSVAMIQGGTTGANNTGYISFFTDNTGTSSEKVRIIGDGNVGIGTNNPYYRLDIGGATSSTVNTLRLHQANGGTAIRVGPGGGGNDITLLRVDGTTSNNSGTTDSGNVGFSLKYMGSRDGNLNALSIFTDNVTAASQIEAVTIIQDGNVGIGVTTPIGHKLQVAGQIGGSLYTASFISFPSSGGSAGNTLIKANDDVVLGFSQNVYIKQGGNVGIGAPSPSAKLHVKEAVSGLSSFDGNADTLILESNANGGMTIVTAAANTGRVIFASPNDATGAEIKYSDATDLMTIGTTNPNADLALQAGNGVEAVRILDDGNVGIGTTDPSSHLDIYTTGEMAVMQIGRFDSNPTDAAALDLMEFDTVGSKTFGVSNSYGFRLKYDGSNNDFVIQSGNTTIVSTRLLIERDTGNVGIGTTAPAQQLHLTGSIRLPNTTSTTTGIIYKDTSRFIHNYQHPTGDTAVPAGLNTFVGISAGNLSMGSTATSVSHGSYNSGFGYQVLTSLTTGNSNTAVGFKAGHDITTAIESTLVGTNAGGNIVNGSRNTFIGDDAGFLTTSGGNNVAVGGRTIRSNTTGSNNTIVGTYALDAHTSPAGHTTLGYSALTNLTTGSYNIAIGYSAGSQKVATGNLTNASYGIYLGYAAHGTEGASGEIVIGRNADGLGSNTTRLGGSNITKTVIEYGKVGIGTVSPDTALHIVGDLTFDGGASRDILFGDNLGAALEFKEGTNPYIRIVTTNGGEKVEIYKTAIMAAGATISGQLLIGDGTAGAPGLAFTNDTNTGMWRPGSDQLRLVTGGSDAITIDSSQQVQFNAYGSGTFTGTATQRLAVDSSGNVIEIPIGSGPVDGSGAANKVTYWTDTDTISYNNNFHWDNTNGNLGIGTDVPNSTLHVYTSAEATARFQSTDNKAEIYVYDNDTTAILGAEGANIYLGSSTGSANGFLRIATTTGNAAFGAAAEGNTRLKIIPRTVEIASNSTNYQKAVYASGLNFYDINSGVTDSGYRIAVDASAFVLDADFEGTLANQYAIWARHGANVSAAGSTITRSIGVYIDSLTNANTTITNLYGLYQEDSVAKNYFSGSVGIGTTSSGSKLHVNGGSKYFGGGDWTTIERVTTTEGNYALYVQTTGTNTNQAIAKFNYGATAGTANSGTSVAAIAREKSYFLSKLGIGTIVPNNDLVVSDGVQSSYTPAVAGEYIEIARTSGGDAGFLINKNTGQWLFGIDNSDGTNPPLRFEYSAAGSAHAGFGNATLGLALKYDGNVGIGTASPQTKLDIYGEQYSSNYPSMLRVIDNVTAFDTDNNGGGISFGGRHTSGGVVGFLAGIQGVKENNTSGNYDGALRFLIRENGSSLLSEKMRIDSSGNVGVGTTNPNYTLHTQGTIYASSRIGVQAVDTNYLATLGGSSDAKLLLTGSSSPYIRFQESTTNRAYIQWLSTTDSLKFQNQQGDYFDFSTHDEGSIGLRLMGYSGSLWGYVYATASSGGGKNIGLLDGGGSWAIRHIENTKTEWRIDNDIKMTLLASGNVGIGTTAPNSKLQVVSSTSGDSVLKVDGTNGTLFEVVDDLSDSLMSVNDAAGLPVFEVFADSHIVAGRYNQNDFYLDTNGNLGLGTSAPSSVLDIYEQSGKDNKLRFHNDTTGSGISNGSRIGLNGAELFINNIENSAIKIYTQSTQTNGITILGDGKVGIGTTDPNYKLHTVGGAGVFDVTGAATTDHHLTVSEGTPTDWRPYSGTTTAALQIQNSATRGLLLAAKSAGSQQLITSQGFDINVNATVGTNAGATALSILTGGNVGIGTTSPSTDFSVKEHLLFNDTTRLLTISNNTNTGGINLDGGNSRLYFSGYRALEGNNSGTTLTVGEGYGTTRISSVLNVVDHETILSPDQGSSSGVASRALTIENINDTSWTADALTAYNATTSYDIRDRASYSFFARPTQGNILTFAAQTSNNSTLHRFVNLNSTAAEPLYRWDFFQYDGSGTGTGDFKVPDKLFQIRVREGVSNVEKFTIKGNGNVGIGTVAPSQKLHVQGNLRITGAFYDSNNAAGTSGQVLTSTGSATDWKDLDEISGVTASNPTTTNYVTKWSDGTNEVITDSLIYDNGTNVGIGVSTPAYGLDIRNSTTSQTGALYVQAALNSSGKGLVINSNTRTTADNAEHLLQIIDRANSDSLVTTVEGITLAKLSTRLNTLSPLQVNSQIALGGSLYTFSTVQGGADLTLTSNANPANLGVNSNIVFKLGTSGGGGPTERMRIASDGKVGIGTTSPGGKLHVYGGTTAFTNLSDNTDSVQITRNTSVHSHPDAKLFIYDNSNSDWAQRISLDGYSYGLRIDGWADYGLYVIHNTLGDVLVARSSELVINESGNDYNFRVEGDTDQNLLFVDAGTDRVGIGLATPNAKLTVSNSSGDVFNILGQSASSVFKVGATGVTQIIGATSNTVLNVLNSGSGDYMNIGSGALFVEKAGNVGIGTTGPSEKLDVVGNVKHQGLTMTSGTDVDQLKTFTQTLTITTSWQDTGIDGSDLTTGTYIVQLIGDDDEVGGGYSVYYSGMMSWFSSGTNDVNFTSEIALHRAGHADSERTLYLRTVTNLSGGNNLELQIAGNYNATGSDSYVFKFRRMI